MKILYYNHTGQVSGAERVLLLVLEKLCRNRFRPEVICPAGGPLSEEVSKRGVRCQEVENLSARFTWRPDLLARYLGSFLRLIRQVRTSVLSSRPDLIHANSIRAGLVATMATIGLDLPVVWHVHDMLPRHPFSSAIRLVVRASRRTHLIAISQAVADRFSGRLFSHRAGALTVILNAVDLVKFRPDAAARTNIRNELGLAPADSIVGIVGQVTPRKGQKELLESFALVVKQLPRTKLMIVGAPLFNNDEEYLRLLKQMVDDLRLTDHVQFLGAREDIPAITNALDLLVVNSRVEPFGLVVVEGMACGTPVVATAVDGIPEILTHGEDGLLVPPRDKQTLASAIVNLLKQPELRSGMAARGLENVRRRFSVERYMRELQDVYLEMLRPEVSVGESESVGSDLKTVLRSLYFVLSSFFGSSRRFDVASGGRTHNDLRPRTKDQIEELRTKN